MVKYREILRLHSLNYSQRQIAASTLSSRNTVHEVLQLASVLNITWSLGEDVTDQALEKLFYPERANKDLNRMQPDFPKIHQELSQKGVTLSLL